ncbi:MULTISPECIES: (Na+)-NQR maturation NqrM [Microbulbifer]|uniref:(Na+)-NQR maturation NqrM n=1 Tax=Microbulbifer TaxID=48073 RepID=UPI001E3F6068|nr:MULTISPECIES: (Na+)-NQR maturation NqrM [Microbulbifer]UHQ55819.1 (Na+)-NQR maturation NqrM [Microbulbifer sp. YPW16]
MTVYIFAFVAMVLVIAGMAVGAIVQNKPLKGSCGGLNTLGLKENCDICGGDDDECRKEQERQEQLAQQADLAYDATRKH